MTESVASASAGTSRRQRTLAAWEQQPGENDLWYARFLRYVAIGPGRSVSLVATGRRNAYPVPAHWPIQAKQHSWRERAGAFDEAVKVDKKLENDFSTLVVATRMRLTNGEADKLMGVHYQAPPPDEYEDERQSSSSR